MAAHLNVIREGKLPPHAWLLQVSKTDTLWCGDNVDLGDDSFFEGAWAGPFEKFDFSTRENVFGSGAVWSSDGWLLVPPSHTLEAIYVLRTNDAEWVASNSIAFVKQFTGFEFLDSDRNITRAFVGIIRGINYSPARLQTSRGTFHLLHHHNAVLGQNGMEIQPKKFPPNFPNYSAYRAYLEHEVKAVAENAGAAGRRATFSSLCTLTKGYNSTACGVLTKLAGCREGITFVNARGGHSDDGTEIGKQLGFHRDTFSAPGGVRLFA